MKKKHVAHITNRAKILFSDDTRTNVKANAVGFFFQTKGFLKRIIQLTLDFFIFVYICRATAYSIL